MADFNLLEPQRLIDLHLEQCPDALLFCGMGISKTAACLYHLDRLFRNFDAVAALVIAPMRVANLTWPFEVEEWDQFRWMKVANLRTDAGKRAFLAGRAHIYTINYEALNTLVHLVEQRGSLPYDVVIFDELTKAKNPGSKRINLYRRKVPRVARQWGLTGTPMPNSWLDVFAQVRLVDNGERLGNNFLQFKKTYYVDPDPTRSVFGEGRGAREEWEAREDVSTQLEQKISDITLTLKSSEWVDIPDTVIEDVEIHFTPELKERYHKLEMDLVLELRKDKTINVANAAALVTKLLQFTSGVVYDDDKQVHHIHDLKMDALKKIVKHEGQPILLSYIFQHEQARIRQLFPQARFFADAKREEAQKQLLQEWNAKKVPILCAHPSSVGHGLNLQHGSSIMVWPTLTYSRESYEQMIFRLARRGQTKVTKVYRLMVVGTVDEAVAEALASKAENEARLISALQMLESYRK